MSATAASTAPQNKSLEWMNRLRANPKIPLIVAGAAAIAIVVAMVLWAKSPDYRTLYSNLSDQDGGAIVTQLTQMNIPYRFADNGGALEVPADKVHELRPGSYTQLTPPTNREGVSLGVFGSLKKRKISTPSLNLAVMPVSYCMTSHLVQQKA